MFSVWCKRHNRWFYTNEKLFISYFLIYRNKFGDYILFLDILERGTVKFSPKCFEKPYDYISLKETNKTIKGFKNYIINGRSNPEPKFVNGVRKMALAALETESIWDRHKSRFKRYTSFLTFASTNGVIYTKPGIAIIKRYNPTTLSWYVYVIFNNFFINTIESSSINAIL